MRNKINPLSSSSFFFFFLFFFVLNLSSLKRRGLNKLATHEQANEFTDFSNFICLLGEEEKRVFSCTFLRTRLRNYRLRQSVINVSIFVRFTRRLFNRRGIELAQRCFDNFIGSANRHLFLYIHLI